MKPKEEPDLDHLFDDNEELPPVERLKRHADDDLDDFIVHDDEEENEPLPRKSGPREERSQPALQTFGISSDAWAEVYELFDGLMRLVLLISVFFT